MHMVRPGGLLSAHFPSFLFAAAAVLVPAIARAEARADEITFEASSASVKHVVIRFSDGKPRDLQIFGPAPMSAGVLAALRARQDNTVYGHLDGLDIRSKEGTSAGLYVLPLGAADAPGFQDHFLEYGIDEFGGYADFAQGPRQRTAPLNDVTDDRGIAISRVVSRLAEYIEREEKAGRTPKFQMGLLVNKGSVQWRRFLLSIRALDDNNPDRPLKEKRPVPSSPVPTTHGPTGNAPRTASNARERPPLQEGDVLLQGRRVPVTDVEGVRGKAVILFGPFEPTPALRNAQEVYLHQVIEYGGRICEVRPFIVDASKIKRGKLHIDPGDAVDAFSTMEDGHPEAQYTFPVHDFDSRGVAFRPLTHFGAWKKVAIAMVVEVGDVNVTRMVVSPSVQGPQLRQLVPAPAK